MQFLGSLTKNRIHRCMYQTTKSMSLLAFVNRLGEQGEFLESVVWNLYDWGDIIVVYSPRLSAK